MVELVDIGLGPDLPDPDVVAPRPSDVRPPEPGPESDKYRRGVVGILAGGDEFTGAAVLSTGGAVHGGAGMVRFASVARPVELVRHRWPEAVTTVIDPGPHDAKVLERIGRVQAWVVGPGLGTDDAGESLLEAVLTTDLPALVDADGLTVLSRRRDLLSRAAPTVLTPHAGELSRLISADRADIEAARLDHARHAAAELSATVLLKGSTTLVAEADRPVEQTRPAPPPGDGRHRRRPIRPDRRPPGRRPPGHRSSHHRRLPTRPSRPPGRRPPPRPRVPNQRLRRHHGPPRRLRSLY